MTTLHVAIFAHNEERFIERAIQSVFGATSDPERVIVYVLINGSIDDTAEIVGRISRENKAVMPVEIEVGDKCNAWNTYVHELADQSFCHFFMDGDCQCSPGALDMMADCLVRNPGVSAVGGMPQNGRSRETLRRYQRDWGWVFGGLYCVRGAFLRQIREASLRLPLGLKGNDHFVTRFLHTALPDVSASVPSQVAFHESAGFLFDSLNPFRPSDARIYWNRLVVYCLRQRQIPRLDSLPLDQLPDTVDEVNRQILTEMRGKWRRYWHPVEHALYRRLRKMYPTDYSNFYRDRFGQRLGNRCDEPDSVLSARADSV